MLMVPISWRYIDEPRLMPADDLRTPHISRQPTSNDKARNSRFYVRCLRVVETGAEARVYDRECSIMTQDTCESFELSEVRIGPETYCSG